jgi:hypothetical protein
MLLNALPLMLAPGFGLAGYALGGLPYAVACILGWASIVVLATSWVCIRHAAQQRQD